MRRRFYGFTRDFHLYLGLFGSPFVLLFSVAVFFLVHTWLPRLGSPTSDTRLVPALLLPGDLRTLSGRPLIDALRPILKTAGAQGEVGFVSRLVKEDALLIPVTIPGRETTVTLNLATGDATVVTREVGLASALAILHRSPGEHAPAIRMNWFWMKAWRWMADTTAYLILFISVSGIYLWYVLRAERRVGFALLFAGALSLFGLAYALSY
ncbi:MAG TPA: PepSY-associated TM helix domain-containing protein [Candidatus Limnocylindria bacterium]|jgi:hypothetical protein|nr:PepSY-associated TM helix domain-containing protein [Candidatus Limnocylindria bacterium]